MARAATTTDAFNAVAEPRRRQILDVLARGERPVSDLVERLRVSQPVVSKHLRVLREVGLVDVRDEGRHRIYSLNGHRLKPIHDWVQSYERTWSERFDKLEAVVNELKVNELERELLEKKELKELEKKELKELEDKGEGDGRSDE